MQNTQNKNLSKAGTLWYRSTCLSWYFDIDTCLVLLSMGSANLEYHPRKLVLPANLGTLSN